MKNYLQYRTVGTVISFGNYKRSLILANAHIKQSLKFSLCSNYRDLFWQLTTREIRARYKQSVLGFSWAVLVPLMNLLVLSLIFSNLFKVPTSGIPYPIYLFVALIPWIFTANSISVATSSILANSTLITKVNLPREIIPISAISAKMVDLFLATIILGIFLWIYGVRLQSSMLFIPIILSVQIFLIMGISFFLSATNVFFRDVENALGVFLTMWMYMTPILYSPDLIPENLKFLFYLNPMTGIVTLYRDVILFGNFNSLDKFIYSFSFSIIIFILGYVYFKNRSRYFADVI